MKIVQENVKKLKNYEELPSERARHLRNDELSMQQIETFYCESAFGSHSGLAGQCESLE